MSLLTKMRLKQKIPLILSYYRQNTPFLQDHKAVYKIKKDKLQLQKLTQSLHKIYKTRMKNYPKISNVNYCVFQKNGPQKQAIRFQHFPQITFSNQTLTGCNRPCISMSNCF
jgi:hypothetical protein